MVHEHLTALSPNVDPVPSSDEPNALLESFLDRGLNSAESPAELLGEGEFSSVLARPTIYRRAARRVEESRNWKDHPLAARIARVFRLRGVVSTAYLGREEVALTLLDRVSFAEENPHHSFRAALYRLFGPTTEAVDQLQRAAEQSERPTWRINADLRHIEVLATAGQFEKARRAHSALFGDSPIASNSNRIIRRYVGLGYALACWGSGSPEQTLEKLLPERFHPGQLTGSTSEDFAGHVTRLYRLATASPDKRRKLRTKRLGAWVRRTLWSDALLARGVSRPHDVEVWLDYALGNRFGVSSPRTVAWSRAELARWRGDSQSVDRWLARTFRRVRGIDSHRDLVLHQLGRP
ncbi:MAG: hypothetical protein ABEN55_11865 [Bradymonadaceae bacterium]